MKDHPAVEKLRQDLAWEGPGGRRQGQLVLPRALAQSLVEHLDRLDALQGLLAHVDAIADKYREHSVTQDATPELPQPNSGVADKH
jgi:hypothetical protein